MSGGRGPTRSARMQPMEMFTGTPASVLRARDFQVFLSMCSGKMGICGTYSIGMNKMMKRSVRVYALLLFARVGQVT